MPQIQRTFQFTWNRKCSARKNNAERVAGFNQTKLKLIYDCAMHVRCVMHVRWTVDFASDMHDSLTSTLTETQFFVCTYRLLEADSSIRYHRTPDSVHNRANRTDWAMGHRHRSQLNWLRVLSKCQLVFIRNLSIYRTRVRHASCPPNVSYDFSILLFFILFLSFYNDRQLPGKYPSFRCAPRDGSIFY